MRVTRRAKQIYGVHYDDEKTKSDETNVINRRQSSKQRAVEQTCACAWISSLLMIDAEEEEEIELGFFHQAIEIVDLRKVLNVTTTDDTTTRPF